MPIEHKEENTVSKRKDTGRTDKYSDESPSKDYKDYRADYSKDGETARKTAEEITLKLRKPEFIDKRSKEVQKQELVSHIQNYKETFNNQQSKAWKVKLAELMVKLEE